MSWDLLVVAGGSGGALGVGDRAALVAVGAAATLGGGVGVANAAPSTRIGIASLFAVRYFSLAGSKYENENGGTASFFSLGDKTRSKVLVPLIPTSSSCLNFDDGGYLCQPCSSSGAGAFTRSKFPRPVIAAVTVTGSPT